MAKAGDKYVMVLNRSLLGLGEERYTVSSPRRKGEAYLAIPIDVAVAYGLYNSNKYISLNVYIRLTQFVYTLYTFSCP